MTSWIDNLEQASFEGVAFYVDNGGGGSAGRRYQLTNFPFSDRFEVQDMGRLHAPFSMQAFLLDKQGDLSNQHIALTAKLNAGEGELVHPRLGRMRVLPGRCRYTFRGGRINYTLEFTPPKEDPQPQELTETSYKVAQACAPAIFQQQQKAVETLDTSSRDLFDGVLDTTNGVLDQLRVVNGTIDAATQVVPAVTQSIDGIAGQLVTLIQQPEVLFNDLNDLYLSVIEGAESVDDALNRYRGLRFDFDADRGASTSNQQTRINNDAAIANAVNTAALLSTVRFVANESAALNVSSNEDSPFDSYPHAIAVRDALMADLDALIASVDHESFDALRDVRAAFYTHIDAHGMRLPRVREIRYGVALPAWVVAFDVYGDAGLMSDVIRRNNIAQPARIEAGTTLEVLSDA